MLGVACVIGYVYGVYPIGYSVLWRGLSVGYGVHVWQVWRWCSVCMAYAWRWRMVCYGVVYGVLWRCVGVCMALVCVGCVRMVSVCVYALGVCVGCTCVCRYIDVVSV